jgi:hypothetical protein
MSRIEVSEHQRISRIALASAVGTIIEWYDFFLYGVLAALVLNHAFFPNYSPFVGTLLSYTTFAIGFIARAQDGVGSHFVDHGRFHRAYRAFARLFQHRCNGARVAAVPAHFAGHWHWR